MRNGAREQQKDDSSGSRSSVTATTCAPFVPSPARVCGMVDGYVVFSALLAATVGWYYGEMAQSIIAALGGAWLLREAVGTICSPPMRGDTVLITGAGSGLVGLLAHRFAVEGCKLVLWDLDLDSVKAVCAESTALGAESTFAKVDVSDYAAVTASAAQALSKFGRVDTLINNAGIVSGMKLLDVPPGLAAKTLDVNTKAHLWTTKAFLPGMLEREHGRVVTIASMAGMLGVAGLCDYSCSKFGAVRKL